MSPRATTPVMQKSPGATARMPRVASKDSRVERERHSYDLVVLGAGPAGLTAAHLAAREGASVALIERSVLGGTSLNTGSIPSNAIIRSARLFASLRECRLLHDSGVLEPAANLQRVMERVYRIRSRIAAYSSRERLERAGIDVYDGTGRFDTPQSIVVGTARLQFGKALIATGARPTAAQISGLEEGSYLTSESIFDLVELPARLAVVGGGPLGCELAQAFCRLGSRVTIVQDEPKFLPREERDAAQTLAESMARDGVEIFLNTRVVGAHVEAAGTRLETRSNDVVGEVVADRVLVSVGRTPNVETLGLQLAGVALGDDGAIRVDEFLCTSNPLIYAAGDVCMAHQFTHVAESTARIATSNLLGAVRRRHTELTIPWCTFCDPEIAHVGLQVMEARGQGIPVKTFTVMMQDVDRAITDRQDNGFVKIHVREGSDTIIGATIVASRASEMVNELCVAMSTGIGLRKLADVLHAYPTQSEAIRLAAMACADESPTARPAPTQAHVVDPGTPRRSR